MTSRSVVATLAAVLLLSLATVGANAQDPGADAIPDISGLDLINYFAKPPADASRLSDLCDMRRLSISTAKRSIQSAIDGADVAADPRRVVRLHHILGFANLYSGDLDPAIEQFDVALRLSSDPTASVDLRQERLLSIAALGITYLRKGEVENCALNHTNAMCIFPLSEAARHMAPAGSTKAIEYFKQYLVEQPSSLEVRWLLNVAYQTLGKYPVSVPKRFLIPPAALVSKEDVGRFVDIAPALGLDVVGNAGGAIVDDFDNDGDLDIVESGVDPCEPMRMFRNNGDGTFSDVSAASKIDQQLGGLNLVQADYNNDGWLDVYVIRGGWELPMRNSLLRNNGDGTFSDVTARAGLGATGNRSQSAAWADYDNDGFVDLYVGHEQTPSELFRNKGDGTFEEVGAKAGVDRLAFTKAVAWGDYDGDGFPDLYVSNFQEANFLYHNRGDGTFEEVASKLGVDGPLKSFPTWFWDYDNDGRLDLFVSSYAFTAGEWVRPYLGLPPGDETMRLYRNVGRGRFTDVTHDVGLDRSVAAMGANFGDLDNDGYLDFYLGTGNPSYGALMPNLMFRNHDGKYFVDVTTSSGTGHLQKGHGVSFADIDNDGNEDIFENMGGAVLGDKYNRVLYVNPGHTAHWISIKLVGVKTNRAAIGAKIKVTLADPGVGSPIRYREVSSGGSFGASPLAQHIGLGSANRIASIQISWPGSKTQQVFRDVAPDRFLEIRELDKTFTIRKVSRISLGLTSMPATHHHSR